MTWADNFYRKTGCDIDADNLPIRAEQIRARLRNYPLMVVGQVAVAPLLAGLMWGKVASGFLMGWVATLYVLHAVEMYCWWRHRAQTHTLQQCVRWRTRFIVLVTALGVVWGSAGVLMFVPGDLAWQVMLICVLLGLAAGAVTVNPVFPPAIYIYVTLIIVPVLFSNLYVGDREHFILAALLGVFLGFVLDAGRNLAQTFELALRRGLENAALVTQLTEEKRSAEFARLAAEQANRLKSKFFAAASHDLRQPMHALTLFVEVLKGRSHDEQTTQLIGQVDRSVEAMGTMFDALLDLSRLDAGVVQPDCAYFAVQPLLDRLYAEFSWVAQDKGLRFEVAHSDAWVYGDPVLLERILRNLVSNAIRYTETGGVSIGCESVAEGVRFEVSDTGIGIPAEHLPHIFEEYYQVGNRQRDRSKGLGLGLAIVRRLTELLGYRMTLDSTSGIGSRFAFVVPTEAPADAMIEQPEAAEREEDRK